MHDLIICTPYDLPESRFCRMRSQQVTSRKCIYSINLCVVDIRPEMFASLDWIKIFQLYNKKRYLFIYLLTRQTSSYSLLPWSTYRTSLIFGMEKYSQSIPGGSEVILVDITNVSDIIMIRTWKKLRQCYYLCPL